MNKKIVSALAVILSVFVLWGCGSASQASAPQTETHTFESDGINMVVSVDLSDGYAVEFATGAVYLYSDESKSDDSLCAFGFPLTQEEYDQIIAERDLYESFDEVGGGVIYADGIADNYAYAVEGGQFFRIAVQNDSGVDPDSVYERFEVTVAE